MTNHELPAPIESTEFMEGHLEFEAVDLNHLLDWGRKISPYNATVVLPFSGGLDSATLSAFLARTVGPENVVAIHVAHSTTQPQETENALAVAESLGVQFVSLDLRDLQITMGAKVNEVLTRLGQGSVGLETTSNASMVYAVVREVARRIGGRVCGTLDGSEILTGYFPKESFYGDFLPLGGLLRQEVRALSQLFGLPPLPEQFAVVPGCGSIVEYVNSLARTNFTSEVELDKELLRLLNGKSVDNPLRDFCSKVNHKTVSALEGRPVYYPSMQRKYLLRK